MACDRRSRASGPTWDGVDFARSSGTGLPALARTCPKARTLVTVHALRDSDPLASARRDDHLEFSQDYAFTSPSGSAVVVSATTINGKIAWPVPDGPLKRAAGKIAGSIHGARRRAGEGNASGASADSGITAATERPLLDGAALDAQNPSAMSARTA